MSDERRRAILARLRTAARAVPGAELATALRVSRQVIVQDIAILRAAGERVLATPHGYLVERAASRAPQAVLAVRHTREQTRDELDLLVDLGLEVVDVVVEHPLYGELRGLLHLRSRDDVARFIRRLDASGARLLSEVTGGPHLHTIRAPRRQLIARARAELGRRGYLVLPERRLRRRPSVGHAAAQLARPARSEPTRRGAGR